MRNKKILEVSFDLKVRRSHSYLMDGQTLSATYSPRIESIAIRRKDCLIVSDTAVSS